MSYKSKVRDLQGVWITCENILNTKNTCQGLIQMSCILLHCISSISTWDNIPNTFQLFGWDFWSRHNLNGQGCKKKNGHLSHSALISAEVPLMIRAELLCVRDPFHWLFKVTDAIIDNFVFYRGLFDLINKSDKKGGERDRGNWFQKRVSHSK